MPEDVKTTKPESGYVNYTAFGDRIGYATRCTTSKEFMPQVLADKKATWDLLAKEAEGHLKGKVTERRESLFQGRPSLTFTVASKEVIGRTRMVVLDEGLISMTAVAEKKEELSSPEVEAYFDSLKTTKDDAPAGAPAEAEAPAVPAEKQ
jgi:hypothetical protein